MYGKLLVMLKSLLLVPAEYSVSMSITIWTNVLDIWGGRWIEDNGIDVHWTAAQLWIENNHTLGLRDCGHIPN